MVRFRLNHPSEIFREKTHITPITLLQKTKLIGANKIKLWEKIFIKFYVDDTPKTGMY